ncbi:unnamed protein product, partial [marine sediment metagenome]
AVIIVLVSFTTVVGFQSVKSTSAINSPLFSVRSKRTIDEDSKDLACDYIGKGKPTPIMTTKGDSRTALLQKVANVIKRMDDKTFNCFLDLVTNRLQQKPNVNDETISEIVTLLEQLRNEQVKPENYMMFQKIGSGNGYSTYCVTYCSGTVCPTESGPLCWVTLYVIMVFILILDILEDIWFILNHSFTVSSG